MSAKTAYGINYTDKPAVWLRCPYDQRERAKGIPGWRWNSDLKVWQWPLDGQGSEVALVAAIRAAFPQAELENMRVEVRALPEPGPPLASLLGEIEYPWRRLPYAQQRDVVAASRIMDRFLVMYDMGTGKTQAAIESACVAMDAGEVERCYIVCPSSVRGVWREEIAACAWVEPEDLAVVRGNPPKDHPGHLRAVSDPEYRKRMCRRRARWTVAHYEAATIEAQLLAPLVQGQFLVVDEAHALKNPQAKRTKAVLSWDPKRAIYQTGTPVVNSPTDAFCVAYKCSPGLLGRNLTDFRDRFVISRAIKVNGRRVEIDVGYRRLDEVRERLLSIGLRRTKADCLDLPPKIRHKLACDLGRLQAHAYADVLGIVAEELREAAREHGGWRKIPKPTVLGQLVRLQQVADGFWPDPENPNLLHWDRDCGKFQAADEQVADAVASGRKVVLWSRFVPLVLEVTRRYEAHGARALHGGVKQEDRDTLIQEFRDDPERKVLALTIQVGGLGLNLQCADLEVFWSRWWSPAVNLQAEDRCHRSGQRNPVDVCVLLTEGTVDEQVDAALGRKGRIADEVTGDAVAEEERAGGEQGILSEEFVRAVLKGRM